MIVKDILDLPYMYEVSIIFTSAHSGKTIVKLPRYHIQSDKVNLIKDLEVSSIQPKINLLSDKACALTYLEIAVAGYEKDGKLF